MKELLRSVWSDQSGQDVAEYALMLAVILAVVVATVGAIGTNANTIFGRVRDGLVVP
jgi:Flp pilus assembly pilin Flp